MMTSLISSGVVIEVVFLKRARIRRTMSLASVAACTMRSAAARAFSRFGGSFASHAVQLSPLAIIAARGWFTS